MYNSTDAEAQYQTAQRECLASQAPIDTCSNFNLQDTYNACEVVRIPDADIAEAIETVFSHCPAPEGVTPPTTGGTAATPPGGGQGIGCPLGNDTQTNIPAWVVVDHL